MPTTDDATMIRTPDLWPTWPCLSLKRGNSLLPENLGVLVSDEDYDRARNGLGKFKVYHVNLFLLPTVEEEWDKLARSEYDSVEALLKDGWMVD